ncbi:MAG: hypothetical protein WCY08_01825 [Rhodocyclaceae bacterium]
MTTTTTVWIRIANVQIGVEAAAHLALLARDALEEVEHTGPVGSAHALTHALHLTLAHLAADLADAVQRLDEHGRA